jgi:hypothetical protein
MKVRELGVTGKADLPELVTTCDLLPWRNRDAALLHMGILGDPTVAVIDNHRISRHAFLDRVGPDVAYADIVHAVAHAQHSAWRGGQHIDASFHRDIISQPDIGTLMSVISQPATGEIGSGRTRIRVDIVLDKTVAAEGAVGRQGKCRIRESRADRL